MNNLLIRYSCLAPMLLLTALPAQAYVGPGLGAGTVGAVLGLLGSILIAIFAFFWYPLKRMFRKLTTSAGDTIEDEEHMEIAEEKE